MEAGIIVKPPTATVASDYAQPAMSAGIKAAPTILPAAKIVTAMTAPDSPRNDLPRPDPTKNQVLIDPQTRDVLFQLIDVSSRRVIRQLPDEALVRMRAYIRTLDNAKQDRSQANTDRAV